MNWAVFFVMVMLAVVVWIVTYYLAGKVGRRRGQEDPSDLGERPIRSDRDLQSSRGRGG